MSVIAHRANELGAKGIVLAAIPDALYFYTALAGTQRPIRGWVHQRGLLPFVFEDQAFKGLLENLSGFVKAPEEESVT